MSFNPIGMPCSGPRYLPAMISASAARAAASASSCRTRTGIDPKRSLVLLVGIGRRWSALPLAYDEHWILTVASRERLEQLLRRQYELRAEKTKAVIREKGFLKWRARRAPQ